MFNNPNAPVQSAPNARRVVPVLSRVVVVCAALIGLMGVSLVARVLSDMESAGPAHPGLFGQALAAQPPAAREALDTTAHTDGTVPDANRALTGRKASSGEPAPSF